MKTYNDHAWKWIALTVAGAWLALAHTASADNVLLNADFASSASTTESTGLDASEADDGWIIGSTYWSLVGGYARRSFATQITSAHGLGQLVTDGGATKNDIVFSFDYVYDVHLSGTLRYDVVGAASSLGTGSGSKLRLTATSIDAAYTVLASGTITLNVGSVVSGSLSVPVNAGAGYHYLGVRLVPVLSGSGGNASKYVQVDNVFLGKPEGAKGTVVLVR